MHRSGSGSGASEVSVLTSRRRSWRPTTLELFANVQFCTVEADPLPGEPEEFTLPQAQDQDQHIRGVEHVVIAAGVFEEAPGFVGGP